MDFEWRGGELKISLLDNKSIDKVAWDKCLLNSEDFELYLQSSYLDIIFPHWKGLVVGEYDAIFPVFENRFIFWKIFKHPLFVGPLSINGVNRNAEKKLIDYLPSFLKQYHWIDINLKSELSDTFFLKQTRIYQFLTISSLGFSPNKSLRKNINKAFKNGWNELHTITADEFIDGLKRNLLTEQNILTQKHIDHLYKVIISSHKANGECIGLFNKNKELAAAQFFLKGNNHLYFILCFSSPEGKKNSAMHFLQSKLIENHLHVDGVLNFGGSNIERIAEFNHNFGSTDYLYSRYIYKKYPFSLF